MPKKYKVIKAVDHSDFEVGDTVYKATGYDYGLARDDTIGFGEPYISVTANEDGSYPSFTHPVSGLEEVE